MKVWIEQDLCTGDAQCVEICPEIFVMHEGDAGYCSYVRPAQTNRTSRSGGAEALSSGPVDVPPRLEADVLDAIKYCPGECIFIDRDE